MTPFHIRAFSVVLWQYYTNYSHTSETLNTCPTHEILQFSTDLYNPRRRLFIAGKLRQYHVNSVSNKQLQTVKGPRQTADVPSWCSRVLKESELPITLQCFIVFGYLDIVILTAFSFPPLLFFFVSFSFQFCSTLIRHISHTRRTDSKWRPLTWKVGVKINIRCIVG